MTLQLWDVPELANFEAGRGLVRIPMEQDVPFTQRVRALVDTAEFQRLKQITQLGLASRVYPGAMHTRFEHALGVFHNAVRYLQQLGKHERFRQLVDTHHADLLLAASLLHDLGHWPFCHPIEDMDLPDVPAHEEFAADFLSADSEIADVLRTKWGIEPGEILQLLNGRGGSGAMSLMRSLLSGPIDIDKMDYLDRDSLHAGVPYGRNFDRNRLIQSLCLNRDGNGLAITSKGKTAAELMVFARYVMFSEVYWHHAVRAATGMFARAFYELRDRLDLRAFFRKAETESISELRRIAEGTDSEPLLEGLFSGHRQLFKRYAEFSLYQEPETYRLLARRPYGYLVECGRALARRLAQGTGEPIRETEILIDAPPPHREIEFAVDIYFPKEDVFRPLHAVSPVVEALARTQFDDYVKRVRIFVHPRLVKALADRRQFHQNLAAAIEETPAPA